MKLPLSGGTGILNGNVLTKILYSLLILTYDSIVSKALLMANATLIDSSGTSKQAITRNPLNLSGIFIGIMFIFIQLTMELSGWCFLPVRF